MLVEDDDSLYVRWADDLFQDCSTTPLDTLLQDGVKLLAARLGLEENSLTRVKNVHIFNRLLELDTLVLKQQ